MVNRHSVLIFVCNLGLLRIESTREGSYNRTLQRIKNDFYLCFYSSFIWCTVLEPILKEAVTLILYGLKKTETGIRKFR